MTKPELNKAINKVAEATNQTKDQIAEKLFNKDSWTWFLVEQSNK